MITPSAGAVNLYQSAWVMPGFWETAYRLGPFPDEGPLALSTSVLTPIGRVMIAAELQVSPCAIAADVASEKSRRSVQRAYIVSGIFVSRLREKMETGFRFRELSQGTFGQEKVLKGA